MSAFMVDDETINRIVSKLNRGDWPKEVAGYNLSNTADCEALANEMFELNVRGVENRYGNGASAKFRRLNFNFKFDWNGTKIGAIKALHCWLFQCAEGDAYKSPLYEAMEDVVHTWEYEVVSHLPEWDKENTWK